MNNPTEWLAHADLPLNSRSRQDVLSTQILAGNSLLLIDAAKRQLDDYVLPLCQLMERSGLQHKTLVLVATRKRWLELSTQFERLLGSRADTRQAEAHSSVLFQRTGLLLATTAQFSALLPTEAHWDCLVLDELERLQAYGASCFEALKLSLFGLNSRMQLLVTTRLWLDAQMTQLLQHAKRPLLLFRAPLEAAVYGGVELQVELGDGLEQQLQQLTDYLKLHPYEKQRTLIYCERETDFQALQQQLPQDARLLHRGRKDMARIEQWRRQQTGEILLLRAHAPELHVDNVQTLIHLNMPPTWSQFSRRFAVFNTQIPNRLLPADATAKPQLQTLMLLDKQSQQMLPPLIEFMQQHGQLVGQKLAEAHAQLQAAREASLAARQCVLCPVLLLYGRCPAPTCQYRHLLLPDIDNSCATVPTDGFIRFQLLKICTPSHFAARLVSRRATVECPWQQLPKQQLYLDLQQQLSSYYAVPEHSTVPTVQELQQICVRRMGDNSYERVCVTFVPPAAAAAAAAAAEQYINLTVRVKHLDLSTVICHAKVSELLVCPLALRRIEALAVDVRLAGLVPYNGEEVWQCSDLKPIAELLHPGGIYEADVLCALSHTIFVNNLQLEPGDFVEQLQSQYLGKFDVAVKDCIKDLVTAVTNC